MAKRSKAKREKPAADAFPKKLVRVRMGAGNQPEADMVTAENAESEATLSEQGYKPFDDVVSEPPVQEYPAWRYSADGSRRVVNSAEEDDALEGDWSDAPVASEQPDQTDLGRAEQTLGPGLARKLNMLSNHQLGIQDAAVKSDGNFDPTTVVIGKADTTEAADAKVHASNSTAPGRGGRR